MTAMFIITSNNKTPQSLRILKEDIYLSGFKKKKHWVDFYQYRVVVYIQCQHTFLIKQHVKEFCKLKFQQPLLAFSMSHDHSEIIVYFYLIIGVFRYSRFSFNFVILVIVSCIMYM